MSYIWEKYSNEKHFKIGKRVCPCLEVFENDLEVAEIEVNPVVRFSEIVDSGITQYDNNGDIFNIILHYLAQLDRVKGLSASQVMLEKIHNEITQGYWGELLAKQWKLISIRDQNIIVYHLAQRLWNDTQTYFMETIGKLFLKTSLCYEKTRELYYLYIMAEKNEYNMKLVGIVKYLFWNMNQSILIVWNYHYGIIGCEDTMRIDSIQIV